MKAQIRQTAPSVVYVHIISLPFICTDAEIMVLNAATFIVT